MLELRFDSTQAIQNSSTSNERSRKFPLSAYDDLRITSRNSNLNSVQYTDRDTYPNFAVPSDTTCAMEGSYGSKFHERNTGTPEGKICTHKRVLSTGEERSQSSKRFEIDVESPHTRRSQRSLSDPWVNRLLQNVGIISSDDEKISNFTPASKENDSAFFSTQVSDDFDRSKLNNSKKPSFLVGNQVSTTPSLRITNRRKWWTQWKGRNNFFFDGRIMCGVNLNQFFMSLTCLLGTWLVFFIFVALEFSGPWCPTVVTVFVCVTVINLVRCAMMDPGIIPPRPKSPAVETMPAAVRIQLNYCMICNVTRPLRTKHCRQCNTCVKGFDHHCPWVGNCIGQRNYRSFLFLVLFAALSAIYVTIFSMLHFLHVFSYDPVERWFSFEDRYGNQYVSGLLAAWSFVFAFLLIGLLSLHTYLLFRGLTTNEFLKKTQVEDNQGALSRCVCIFVGKVPPSQLPPMHSYPTEDDIQANNNYAATSFDAIVDEHSRYTGIRVV